MDPKTIIRNDAQIEFKFFHCPTHKKRVRAGKCIECDSFPCETLTGLIRGKEKEYYKLVKTGRTAMKEYVIKTRNKTEVISETSLKKRSLPDKCEVYQVKNKYRVENKLVKSERKQRDFFAHKEGDTEFKQLKNIDYKSGDIIHELGTKHLIQKVLVKITEPKKKRRRSTKKKKGNRKKSSG